MSRAQEVERVANAIAVAAGIRVLSMQRYGGRDYRDDETISVQVGLLKTLTAALALPAEEVKLETTVEDLAHFWEACSYDSGFVGMYAPTVRRDIDTLLSACPDRDGVIEAVRAETFRCSQICSAYYDRYAGADSATAEGRRNAALAIQDLINEPSALRTAPQDERGKIVGWLRTHPIIFAEIESDVIADAIERGDHLKEKP